MIVLFQLIVHDRTILALNHEDGLLDLNALDFIRKDRKRVEAKLLQVTEALWMNNSRITIGGNLKSLSFNEEGFFEFRKQHKTPHRAGEDTCPYESHADPYSSATWQKTLIAPFGDVSFLNSSG